MDLVGIVTAAVGSCAAVCPVQNTASPSTPSVSASYSLSRSSSAMFPEPRERKGAG